MDKFGFDEVTSSAGDVQQDAVGILLTKGGMMDGTDSATARHEDEAKRNTNGTCLLYTSPSPRDLSTSRMPSSA